MNIDKELRKYERTAYQQPKVHAQTCCGYATISVFLTLVFLITAGALLGVSEQRKKFNESIQQTTCFVDSTKFQSNNFIVSVHYETSTKMNVNSTATFNYQVSDSFTCYYDKKQITKLVDLRNESEVFIPSMVLFALSIVPMIAIAIYYFAYWKKLGEKTAEP